MSEIAVERTIIDTRQFLMVGMRKLGRVVCIDGRHLIEIRYKAGKKMNQYGEFVYTTPEDLIAALQEYIQ